ncbi:MAG TPA: hypothetical protein VNH18_08805 [Bryobacteraceae bacterium]|nr:hypothetical protein [Bryobacteraceae bacterium]
MKAVESPVAGILIHGPETPEFDAGLLSILGRAPKELLRPALPYSVIVDNESDRTVAFLGVRFDMVGPRAKQYSVVHYADSLRNPLKADFKPGTKRFICAEPEYTALVIRGDVAAQTRGRMNLENLRKMLQIKASIDCLAFADGQFAGPDSQETFDRFAAERETEAALVAEMQTLALAPDAEIEAMLYHAVQDPVNRARRYAARKLLEGYEAGGRTEALTRAANFRMRVALWR